MAYDEDARIQKAYEMLKELFGLENPTQEWADFVREALEEVIYDATTH